MDNTNNDIDKFIKAYRMGYEKGFTYFYRQYFPTLCFFAYRIIKDDQRAMMIVQESFAELWRDHATIYQPHIIKLFLYKVVFRFCTDHKRNNNRNVLRRELMGYNLADKEERLISQMIYAETMAKREEIINGVSLNSR